ncbi:MAG: hypothetical protein CVV64_15260 [Candidatus Wallbacteria bacterium HGW-Wallbacteria-1]|jgi:hypothetical protein|uniref:DUF3784 domain-containing protein n=1 Tax=Candidatus Wallbacteria bacterium HGW-Wallbacteria-1 TaxID=2013854 RepID=A0A2N1PLP1_9BACT|nr:MAG: hypothetical protein CVV64_15260 [Candidatus Wallbacteria bacterium HGW-Wallbacteria-1]
MLVESYIFSIIILALLWIAVLSPLTMSVKAIIGKENYKVVTDEYRTMTKEKILGTIAITIGFLNVMLLTGSKSAPPAEIKSFAIPMLFILGGFHCFITGYVKALAKVIKKECNQNQINNDITNEQQLNSSNELIR